MPRVLTGAEWAQLLTERDPFKLAIRGQSGIEAMIDAAIMEAVEGRAAEDLLRLPFRTRLTLAVALGLVLDQHSGLLRNWRSSETNFAHGTIVELTAERAQSILDSLVARLPEGSREAFAPAHANPRMTLVASLIVARALVETTMGAHWRKTGAQCLEVQRYA